MSIWMLETFGDQQLTEAFWFITLMTSPFWLAMLLFPSNRIVRRLSHPFLFPTLLCGMLIYLYSTSWGMGLPKLGGHQFSHTRGFFRHPMVFLSLWCKLMILNLFLGTVLFREANRLKIRVPVELIVAWLFGPAALILFSLHLLLTVRRT